MSQADLGGLAQGVHVDIQRSDGNNLNFLNDWSFSIFAFSASDILNVWYIWYMLFLIDLNVFAILELREFVFQTRLWPKWQSSDSCLVELVTNSFVVFV